MSEKHNKKGPEGAADKAHSDASKTQGKAAPSGDGINKARGQEDASAPSGFARVLTRAAVLGVEVLAIVFLLVVIASAGLFLRLQNSPMEISFAKSYVEQSLRNEVKDLHVEMEDIVLFWPDMSGPLLLGLKNAKILDADDNPVLSVDEVAIGLSQTRLLIGQVAPKVLLIKKPALRVVRSEDGSFDFGLGAAFSVASGDTGNGDLRRDIVEDIIDVIGRPGSAAPQGTPLGKLEQFRIEQASLHFEDRASGAAVDLPAVNIDMRSTEEGLMAGVEIALNETAVLQESEEALSYPITAQLFLDWDSKQSKAEIAFDGLDFETLAAKVPRLQKYNIRDLVLNGTVVSTLDSNFMPVGAVFELAVPEGQIQHEDISDAPVPLKDMVLKGRYQGNTVEVETLSLGVRDVRIHAGGKFQLRRVEAGLEALQGTVKLRIDDMPEHYIEPLWPKVLEEENAKKWIVDRMMAGNLSGLLATVDVAAQYEGEDEGWTFDASNLRAEFSFENMTVDYRNPLPPVTNAKGSGVFLLDEESLKISVTEGDLGGMRVQDAQLNFSNIIESGKGVADLTIPLQGPLQKAFEYISIEPIDLKDALDMDVSLVKGAAEFTVKLKFPAIADLEVDQVEMDIAGTARDVFLPDVVQGLPVTGGPFGFEVNNERYVVKGSGTVSGRPMQAEWQEYLESEGKPYKNRAKVQVSADPKLRAHFGIDLEDFVEGPVALDITYTGYRGGGAIIAGKGDAKDAVLKLEPFDYRKEPGAASAVNFKLELAGDVPKELTGLAITAPGLKLEGGQLVFGESVALGTYVKQARIEQLNVGETVGSVDFETEKNGRLKIVMNGPFLDLRPFLEGDDDKAQQQVAQQDYENPPLLLSVAVDQMRTTDEETVQYGKLYADIDGQGRFNQLEMDAIAGGGDIYLRYKPDESGARTFRFEADNAGAALKAFGVYDKIRGGKIVVYAEPIDNVYDRNLVGLAEMTDFKVVNAPVLARLFGAMSLPGLMELLDGEGVSFSKLEAGFDWVYRPHGGLLVLKDGRTSGNSLGLTFDGVFDNPAQKIDVSGTIIPLSGINKVVTSIPLIGDILSGGSGAIFAATYTIKGSSEDPEINVNPLAALAPGILRRILFE